MDPGTDRFGRSRREFLQALGGALGVAIIGDAATLGEVAEAAAKRNGGRGLPSGYVWQTVLTARDGQPGVDGIDHIFECVMINDRSEVIFHARKTDGRRCVYRMRIGRGRKPGARRPRLIVEQGQTLPDGAVVGKLGAGDTNSAGTFVIPIGARGGLNALYMQRPGRPLHRIAKGGGLIPGPKGNYTGHFGDVDVDDRNDVLVVARFALPGEVHQGLIRLPNGRRRGGRVLLRTGHKRPDSRAVITGLGLIERRGPYFIQQVFGRRPMDRRRHDMKTEPTGFVSGKVARGRKGARLLVGSNRLKVGRSVISAEALIGPRVTERGTAATVSHKSGDDLALHRHGPGRGRSSRIARTGARTGGGRPVQTISAPLFGRGELLYYRTIRDKTMELFVLRGGERRKILETGDRIGGGKVGNFNTGWHTDQVDSRGRLAFQVRFQDGRTGIVIGTPI
jgi:hypothetical protein